MKKKSLRYLTVSGLSALAGFSGFILAQEKLSEDPPPLTLSPDTRPIERVTGTNPTSYAPMLEEATKSVVSVYTKETVRVIRGGGYQDDLFNRLFGIPRRGGSQPQVEEELQPQGIGSGVIVSSDGYILTNNHVVMDRRGGDADQILVRLSDDRELEATLVGRDPQTDVAVIKVDGTGLPAATLADSEQIKVGDIVFAIGNPLGVGQTVTSGIVSATGRSIGIYERQGGYEDFIQTDAAINQGNSGGALVDIEGRVIGINSAIMSNSGGSIGLGFAIPSNLASSVANQLTDNGEVKRGLIGIRMGELTPDLAEALGLPGKSGVLIDEVVDGFPAKKAGLKHGDVITSINGRNIDDIRELRLAIAEVSPGTSLTIKALRSERENDELVVNEKTFEVEVADPDSPSVATLGNLFEGVTLSPVDQVLRDKFSIPDDASGLIVTEIDANSPYSRYLTPGVVILELNKRPVRSLSQARKVINPDGRNLLYVYHRGRTQFLVLDM
ncbi:MAG: Do family serine endopeptidase [Verrucomicrobiota bacterium JB023]|nr:Do family serine endopeptidase [Verrucomicrobiota bacterium JB023]